MFSNIRSCSYTSDALLPDTLQQIYTLHILWSPGACAYYETSSLLQEGVSVAMEGAVRAALSSHSGVATRRRGFRLPWRRR